MNLDLKIFYESDSFELAKGHSRDAGYDVRTKERVVFWKNSLLSIDTGIRIDLPDNVACVVMNKSGLGSKGFWKTSELIDPGYTGTIKIVLNYSGALGCPYAFNVGDKIAQLVFIPFYSVNFIKVHSIDLFDKISERGDNGFGSTGK